MRGHITIQACICVEAKVGRNEKLCGIKRLQGSERETMRVFQSVARPSQQASLGFQNGCLGKVLHASAELAWEASGEVSSEVL